MTPRQPRGAVQDPIEDYHDTARTGHEKSRRCVSLATSATTAEKSNSLLYARTTYQEAPAMNHCTCTPSRPANIPPRFQPQCDTDGSLMFWGADLVVSEELEAEAVKYPADPSVTLFSARLHVEEGTAEEIRAALDRLCTWWQSQEAHLDGTEAAR